MHAQWTNQNTGVSSIIWGIEAVDENTVWAGTGNGTYLRTTNGGQNWESGVIPGAEALTFYTVEAMDAETAYFAGMKFNPVEARIYKTSDGGQNWELQYQGATGISSIAFWDEDNGIATAGSEGSIDILTTSNGGVDWSLIPAENIPPALPGEFSGFVDAGGTGLAVAGSSHAWFGTAYANNSNHPSRVFRTADRGQTWTVAETPLPTSGQYHGNTTIAFKDTLNGFAAGFGGPIKTTDGGQTWTLVGSNGASTLLYVPETNDQVLFAAATFSGCYYSGDGGETWTRVSTDVFIGASFVNATTGWAGRPNGRIAKFNGELMVTTDTEQISEAEAPFRILQNHPNPFSGKTVISFAIVRHTPARLEILDLSGAVVARLVNEKLSPGKYSVEFDAEGLPSGVYACRLQAGDFVETKKLVVTR